MTTAETSMYYMKSSCMLFIGGLMVAIAIENSNLHRLNKTNILIISKIFSKLPYVILYFLDWIGF